MSERDLVFLNARRQVSKIIPQDVGRRVFELGGAAKVNPTERKRMEYALLIGPLTRGLEIYLDEAVFDEPREHIDSAKLLDLIGARLGQKIINQLMHDPNYQIASGLARERAVTLENPVSDNIFPLGRTIIAASLSSASSMYESAASSALAIKTSPNAQPQTREEFIEMVKRSTRQPIERAFSSLAWQPAQDEANYHEAMARMHGSPPAEEESLSVFDSSRQAAKLGLPIPSWPDHLNLSGKGEGATIGDIEPFDEHIGCPVSFKPKLVVRYYQHVVDMIEYHSAWPEFLQSIKE